MLDDDDEDLDPELLAEISNLGGISEAEIEAERFRILSSESSDFRLLDLDDEQGDEYSDTASIALEGNRI